MDRSILRLNKLAKLEKINLGAEGEPLIKIDNFMWDAHALKRMAVDAPNFSIADSFYPGIRMPIHEDYLVAIVRNLAPYLAQFFGFNLSKVTEAAASFSIVTTQPKNLSVSQCIPHFDAPSRQSLAMIHYLCDAADAGTAFYRHKKTGFEYITESRRSRYMQQLHVQGLSESKAQPGYIYGDNEEFEVIASYAAEFNRILLYRGSSLHSGMIPINYNFDSNPNSGRLTITSFMTCAH